MKQDKQEQLEQLEKQDKQEQLENPKRNNVPKLLKHGSLSLVFTAVFIAGVIMLNIIVSLLSERLDARLDLTAGQLFSVSQETVDYLKNITDSITITVCSKESDFLEASPGMQSYYNQTNEILKRFAGASPNITLKYLDLMTNPDFAAKYDKLNKGSIIIESKGTGRHKVLTGNDYFSIRYYSLMDGSEISEADYREYAAYGMSDYVTQDVSAGAESAFLSAVISVTDVSPVNVGLLAGSGEFRNDGMITLLEKNAYTIHTLDLITGEIPPEIDFIISDSPSADYSDDTLKKLSDWLDNGGKFGKTLLYSAHLDAFTPKLDAFLADEWKIGVNREYVMQSDSRYTAPTAANIQIQYYKPGRFDAGLNPEYRVYGMLLRHVTELDKVLQNVTTTAILSSYEGAVLVPFEETGETGAPLEEKGAYPVGVMSSKVRYEDGGDFEAVQSNVIAFGGSFIFDPGLLEMRNANNAEYLISMMNEINGKEAVITVAPKSFGVSTFEISEEQAKTIGLIFAVILPLAIIATGTAVWIRRRRRK